MANRKISQLPEATTASSDDIIPVVDTSDSTTKKIQVSNLLADQITEAERTKLTGIAEGATANQTDEYLLNRANQTGTQLASSISDFNTQVTQVITSGGGGATDADLRDRSTHTGTQTLSTISDAGTAAGLDVPTAGNAGASEVVKGNDTRLTNARTPTSHTHTASQISDFSSAVSTEITNNAGAGHGTGTVTEHNDVSNAGSGQIITTAERTKLSGIASGATANASDATLKNRANHTGTQTLSTISDAGTSASLNVASSGDASNSQVVKGNDSRLTDARHPILP